MSLSSGPPNPAVGRVTGADLLLLMIIGLGSMRYLGPLFFSAVGSGSEIPSQPLVALFLLLHSVLLLVALRQIVLLRHGLTLRDLGLGPFEARWLRTGIFVGMGCLPVVAIITLTLQNAMETPKANPQIDALMGSAPSPLGLMILLPVGAFVVPLLEEVLFRGLFFRWLIPQVGSGWAVVISSAVFAVLHGVPHLIPAVAALAAILALTYARTGSLWPAIVAHGFFNAVNLILVYLVISAGDMPAAGP